MEVTTTEFIANTGFPIAACLYLLWERDKRVADMTQILVEIKTMLRRNN